MTVAVSPSTITPSSAGPLTDVRVAAIRPAADDTNLYDLAGAPFAHVHCDDEHGGALLDLSGIVSQAAQGSHFYCCGPMPMLQAYRAATAAIPPERVHFEYFSPQAEASKEGGFVVELARSGQEVFIPPGQSILETLREAGLTLDSSCQEGICGVCETKVVSGIPDHRDSVLSDYEHAINTSMMICCSGCKSERLVLDLRSNGWHVFRKTSVLKRRRTDA